MQYTSNYILYQQIVLIYLRNYLFNIVYNTTIILKKQRENNKNGSTFNFRSEVLLIVLLVLISYRIFEVFFVYRSLNLLHSFKQLRITFLDYKNEIKGGRGCSDI